MSEKPVKIGTLECVRIFLDGFRELSGDHELCVQAVAVIDAAIAERKAFVQELADKQKYVLDLEKTVAKLRAKVEELETFPETLLDVEAICEERDRLRATLDEWRDAIRTTGYDGASEIVQAVKWLRAQVKQCQIVVEAAAMVMEAELEPRKRALETVARLSAKLERVEAIRSSMKDFIAELVLNNNDDEAAHITCYWQKIGRALAVEKEDK